MSKLGHYKSTGKLGEYSNIEMDNGELCFISVAQTGVFVKKMKKGFFGSLGGKKIYTGDLHKTAETAQRLSERYSSNLCPSDIKNAVLRVFTNAGLHCQSSDEFERILNDDSRIIIPK